MHILTTGAAGMLGRKLTQKLAQSSQLGGREIDKLTLVDVVAPDAPAGFGGKAVAVASDITSQDETLRLIATRPDLIFHLAAIVSGEAEADFDNGYQINLDGTRFLFEAIRAEAARTPSKPRVVFTSSIAVFGAPFPQRIADDFFTTPLTSCGTQKAIGELLLSDYSRRGIFDGIGLRLPTICIRPGKPNKAASGFYSNILREPLVGQEAVLPVSENVRHWHASPRAAIEFFVRAATMDLAQPGWRRNLTMKGYSATVGEQIAALARVAGLKAASLIRRGPDPKSRRSSPAGRATSTSNGRSGSASARKLRSTKSFAHISMTNSVGI
jgi:nucleoside-diphosphate-sugar epimerase